MNSPNDYQVGGTHYKSDYEEWDFNLDVYDGCFFLGNANKYITRWKKKDWVRDLEKALHYLEKAKENYTTGRMKIPLRKTPECQSALVAHYVRANSIGLHEETIIRYLVAGSIIPAIALLKSLIESESTS